MANLDKNILLKLVLKIDNQLVADGVLPHVRPIYAYQQIAFQLKRISDFLLVLQYGDPLLDLVKSIYQDLYREVDLWGAPVYAGAVMFRDVFFPIYIPDWKLYITDYLFFSNPALDWESGAIRPSDFLSSSARSFDMTELQKQWLFSEESVANRYFDQFFDCFDFAHSLKEVEMTAAPLPDRSIEWFYLAKQYLEAAAATLLSSFNKYVAIQNCCLAVEVLLKGALLTVHGFNERRLRDNYGHDLNRLVHEVVTHFANIDGFRLRNTIQTFPGFVATRYTAQNISRIELGNYFMTAQYVAGEVLRQFSKRDLRQDFIDSSNGEWDFTQRIFP
ncbi:hypothetical protein [Gloeobacter kilaueensis]|uniref:HEPN domain-containing protein n=1 Tax=Gloeobacter kilaueensis (strain ATCC BAA-2537 / CCAP 1431/1 / ULC 316 / JS1) TaxID=1183438 RepID=U5QNG1_GLOK1|nr:hypothetical protein [Gloeobacter kilaueensis]AGY60461.1 hypothetical protein GKIL_4215 [Gloeobacter kilaueensis JS1]